jgi:hypothetical protein
MIFRKFLLILFSSLLVVGCTSIASKNVNFLTQPKESSKQSRKIEICRPSAFFHGLNSVGVRINSLDAFDLGSGERYILDLTPDLVNLQFLLPNQDALNIRERKTFNLIVPNQTDTAYVIVSHNKGGDDAALLGAIGAISPLLVYTITWKATPVSKSVFEQVCGVESSKTQYLTDKFLN